MTMRCSVPHTMTEELTVITMAKNIALKDGLLYQDHQLEVCSKVNSMKADTGFDPKLDRRRSGHSHYKNEEQR